MNLGNRLKNRRALMSIGMACLLLGNVAHYFLRPATHFGKSLADGTFGLLLGVSIGSLLLSLRLGNRRGSID